MMNSFKTLSLAAALLVGTAIASSAATVQASQQSTFTAQEKANSIVLPSDASFSPAVSTFTGTLASNYRSPFADSTTAYFAVGAPTGTASPATLSFSSDHTIFSMLWGSPDPYNQLMFYYQGNLVATVNPGTAGGNTGLVPSPRTNAYKVTVTGITYDTVVFYDNYNPKKGTYGNDTPAFEFANISTVPVPAAGILLLSAFGGVAALRRRKQA